MPHSNRFLLVMRMVMIKVCRSSFNYVYIILLSFLLTLLSTVQHFSQYFKTRSSFLPSSTVFCSIHCSSETAHLSCDSRLTSHFLTLPSSTKLITSVVTSTCSIWILRSSVCFVSFVQFPVLLIFLVANA